MFSLKRYFFIFVILATAWPCSAAGGSALCVTKAGATKSRVLKLAQRAAKKINQTVLKYPKTFLVGLMFLHHFILTQRDWSHFPKGLLRVHTWLVSAPAELRSEVPIASDLRCYICLGDQVGFGDVRCSRCNGGFVHNRCFQQSMDSCGNCRLANTAGGLTWWQICTAPTLPAPTPPVPAAPTPEGSTSTPPISAAPAPTAPAVPSTVGLRLLRFLEATEPSGADSVAGAHL